LVVHHHLLVILTFETHSLLLSMQTNSVYPSTLENDNSARLELG